MRARASGTLPRILRRDTEGVLAVADAMRPLRAWARARVLCVDTRVRLCVDMRVRLCVDTRVRLCAPVCACVRVRVRACVCALREVLPVDGGRWTVEMLHCDLMVSSRGDPALPRKCVLLCMRVSV